MPTPPPKRKTTVFLEPDDIRLLKTEAALSGLTASELVAEMLRKRISERQFGPDAEQISALRGRRH
jgi:hypothetical protein